jgi:hypothetical protein
MGTNKLQLFNILAFKGVSLRLHGKKKNSNKKEREVDVKMR